MQRRFAWSIHRRMLEISTLSYDSHPHENYSQPHHLRDKGRTVGIQVRKSALLTWFNALTASLLLAATGVAAASTEMSSIADEHLVTVGIDWCKAPRTATRAGIAAGHCQFEPVLAGERGTGFSVGFHRESVWLRLRLRNDSDRAVERWLQAGLARASDVTVYQQTEIGEWLPSRLGYEVPRARRDRVGQYFKAVAVTLAPRTSREIFIRVVSKPQISLKTTLWKPDALIAAKQTLDVWMGLVFGGLLLGGVVTTLMFFSTREPQYGFFSVALVGEWLIETVRTGFMVNYLWPATLPLPVELTNLGGILAVLGFSGYAITTLPSLRQTKWLYASVIVLLASALLFQIYGLLIDFQVGTLIWGTLVMPIAMAMIWASVLDIRAGRQYVLWILPGYATIGLITAARGPVLGAMIPNGWVDIVISPVAMLTTTVLVILALTERSRGLKRDLAASKVADASRVAFLARMSHELRTPLDIVLGNTQLVMRSKKRELMTPELTSIMQSGRHLLSMIDKILDYSRRIAGALKLRPEPVTVLEFIEAVKISSQTLVARNRNNLVVRAVSGGEISPDLVLLVDAGRLRQVLDNLIVNAARHTHDGCITLEYGVRAIDDGRRCLSFAVIDTGEGIAADEKDRIFEPFERVERAARYGGKGAGMGLAIVRQLVTLMGGEISVQSTLGKRSAFRFMITAERVERPVVSHAARRQNSLPTGYAGPQRLALIIDDDPGSRAVFSAVLEYADFAIREADSGNAALALLDDLPRLDVVVTDQFMPDGDGWAVLGGICRRRAEVPCIMISAAAPSPSVGHLAEQRFTHTFLKPVDHAALLEAIGKALRLEWRWATDKPATLAQGAAGRAAAAPTKLDQNSSSELRQLVEYSEITAIRDWARRLRQLSLEHGEFADKVEIAAIDLDFTTLETLCEIAVATADHP